MPSTATLEHLRRFEIPGLIQFQPGNGGFIKAVVTGPISNAETYLHGAQVTAFQKHGDAPLLFLSSSSRFEPGKAIRGGVPICFPWFGPRPGDVAHGFARITEWELVETAALPGRGALLRFRFPPHSSPEWSSLRAEFFVRITDQLELQLEIVNTAADRSAQFEACLHTYFFVGDVTQCAIEGLERQVYLDKMLQPAPERRTEGLVRIAAQTDRTYVDTTGPVSIMDPVLGRTIHIAKSGSASTVVWNPWTTQILADLGHEEYRRMLCVESGNVERNKVRLEAGGTSRLRVVYTSTAALGG